MAGKLLAEKLHFLEGKNAVVLAIPRGGVAVGRVLADELSLPLDVVVTRKLRAPSEPELAIGAVGPANTIVLVRDLIAEFNVSPNYLAREIDRQMKVINKRALVYRSGKSPLSLKLKTVILVDDGIATGATVEAAIKYLRTKTPREIILAVPVAPASSTPQFGKQVEKLVVLLAPENFRAVGDYYKNFPQVTDEEVVQLLHR